MKPATSQFVDLRGERHHVTTWGRPDAPKLFLLHGWMDVGASFQFLVDAFSRDWYAIAPDLRGFGRSAWQPQGYWFQDYVADLDALLAQFAPDEQVNLLGHSLGGNVVMHYAGVRSQRVRRLVSLDGFGIPAESPADAPRKFAAWLDALADPPAFSAYASIAAVADRLQKNNPRLPRGKAEFLAAHWATTLPDGSARLVSDPRHKLPFPTVYRMEEIFAVWRNIAAPVLWVAATDSHIPRWLDRHPEGEIGTDGLDGVRRRLGHIPDGRLQTVADAGHMLHHDQPAVVAALIESFLAA
ncbi:MAG TPA: alpha/beta hydrolase [Casimicrobiaceae bacterium]|nr:alpha/beta hydrolase [Casimicrobiaceae bacterium]